MTLQETITASAEYLLTHVTNRPTVALVLGSGLGDFADTLENPVRIPYKDIPNFPRPPWPGITALSYSDGAAAGKSSPCKAASIIMRATPSRP